MKKLKIFLLAIVLTLFGLLYVDTQSNIYAEEATGSTVTGDVTEEAPEEEFDITTPIRDNSIKGYTSTIPDAWYDESQKYGMNYDDDQTLLATAYMDILIETDDEVGVKNLVDPTVENPVIDIPYTYGDSINLYLEMAWLNWTSYFNTSESYSVESYSNDLSFSITQQVSGTTYDVFTSSEDNTRYIASVDNGIYKQVTYNYDINTGVESFELTEDYHMPVVTVTPAMEGFYLMSFGLSSIASGSSKAFSYDIILHFYDAEYDTTVDHSNALLYTDSNQIPEEESTYAEFDMDGENNEVFVSLELCDSYCLVVDPYGSYSEQYSFQYSISINSTDVEIDGDSIKFLKSGRYRASVRVYTIILVESYYGYENITNTLDYSFTINAYSSDSIDIDGGLQTKDKETIYLSKGEELSFSSSVFENDNFVVTYYLDDVESNNLISGLSTGNYNFKIVVEDLMLYSVFEKDYVIAVVEESKLNEAPVLSSNDITIAIDELGIEKSIYISNYEYISSVGELGFDVVLGDVEATLNGGTFIVTNASLGVNKINFYSDYNGVVASTTLTIHVINEYEFVLSQNEVVLNINEEANVSLGYLIDDSFTNMDSSMGYAIFVYNNSNIITTQVNDYDITISSNDITGNTNVSVSVMYDGSIVQVLNLKISIINNGTDDEPLLIETSFVEEGPYTIDLNIASTITLTIDVSNINLYSFTWISSDENIVTVTKTSDTTATITAINRGTTKVMAISQNANGTCYTATATIDVVNGAISDEPVTVDVDFVEGDILNIIINNNNEMSLTLDVDSNTEYNFVWMSLDTNIATVVRTSNLTAKIIGLQEGSTKIIAISQGVGGVSYMASATLNVIADIPKVIINVDKSDDFSSFNVYDLLHVSLDTSELSNDIEIDWYLNDVLLTQAMTENKVLMNLDNSTDEFYLTFTEGTHNISAVIYDNVYELEVTVNKEISVTKLQNKDRVISFAQEEIYLILSGNEYKLTALIDGVVDDSFKYTFTIDDSKVVKKNMIDGASVLLTPIGVGETKVNVFTDIGNQYEEKIIYTSITIIVEELESINIIVKEEFNKPGDDVVFDILVNGKSNFTNYTPDISVSFEGADTEYEVDGSKIIVKNAKSGKYNLNVEYGDIKTGMDVEVSNFNLKEFILIILPYLIIIAIFAIVIYMLFKSKTNPYKNAVVTVSKLVKYFNVCEEAIVKNDSKYSQSLGYKKTLKITNSLHNKLSYYVDEGVDEFNRPINTIKTLESILEALLKTYTENVSKKKALMIIRNIKENQVNKIECSIIEIIESRRKYDEQVKKQMSSEEKKELKKKKKKMSKEEYNQYLLDMGLIYDDRNTLLDDDVDDDNSN